MNKFLNTLFNEEELICLTTSRHRDLYLSAREFYLSSWSDYEFFCINPVTDGRKATDISNFRNFLIEIDDLPIEEQLHYIKGIRLPFSTAVYSGGKSIHFIISLEEEINDKSKYDFLSLWIHNIVSKADHATKNSNRLSRLPNVIRNSSKKVQTLLKVNRRISTSELMEWLKEYEDCVPVVQSPRTIKINPDGDRAKIVYVLDWYFNDYMKKKYSSRGTHTQCPVCASEGRDRGQDNMFVSGDEMRFHCFADDSHNKQIFTELLKLHPS